MDSISIIPGGNTGGATEDTGVVGDNPNTAPIETGAFLATTGSIQFADTDTGPGIFHVPYATPIGTTLGTMNVNIFDDATGGADTGFIDWSYAVDNALVQYLAAGQTRVESFDILIVGYDGEEQHVTVSVTLVGTNDGPTMGGSSSSTLTEDAALGVTGNFAFNDVDVLDTHTASVTVAATGDTTGLALSNGALQALLSTAVTSTTTAASGVLNYSFAGDNDDFQYLKLGETLTLTYTLTIADGNGGTAQSTVSINITGSNDVPTITAAAVMGGITEAGAVGVGVNMVSGDASGGGANWVDLDHGEDTTLAITDGSFGVSAQSALSFTGGLGTEAVIAGTYGTLYLQANGQYRYVLDNADIDTQSLDDGSAPTEVFNYTVVGAGTGSAISTITINIAGTNDAPVLGVVSPPAAFTEAANASAQTLSATGSFTVTDVDGNDTLTPVASGAVVRLNGNVISSGFPASLAAALNITPATQNSSAGTVQTFNWGYTPAASDLDFLSVTDTLTITYPVSVSDGTTAPTSQNIVVTINGTNDAPDITISIDDAATGDVTETTGGGLTVSDTLTVTDLDLNDSVIGAITGVTSVGNDNGISSAVLQAMLSITSGDLTVPGSNNGQLSWTFNSGAEGFEFLQEGETLDLQYTLQVSDGQGGTDVQAVTVTVTGTNDVPALSGVLTPPAAYVDPSAGGAIALAAAGARSGSFVVADADTGDVLEVSDADNNGLTTTDIHAIRSAAVFTWYDVGGIAVLGTSTGLTTGSGGSPFADADTISTIDLGTDDRGDILNAFYVDSAVYNAVTQSLTVSWSFDNATSAAQISVDTNTMGSLPSTIGGINVNFLGNGESLVVVFPITVTDSDGGSTTVNVPITFNGTNDQPALAAAAGSAGLVDEDTAVVADNPNTAALETGAFVTVTGTKNFSDLDANDVLTSVASVASITPSIGVTISPALTAALNDLSNTFLITQNTTNGTNDGSIVWNFAVDNGLIQGLKNGDSIVVVYTITLSDDSGTGTATRTRDVTITITGTNDVPVAVADTNALDAVIEGGITPLGAITLGDATATGNLLTNDTDVDLGDTQAVAVGSVGTFAGTYGSVTIAANGTYTYTLNNGDADTNALAVGEVVTEVFNYTMQDSAGATSSSTLTITITGTNDGPAFTGPPAFASFTEEAPLTAAGSLAFNDVDVTDVHTNTVTVASSGAITGLALTNTELLALFSTTMTSTTMLSSGSVGWAFAGSNPAFQYLAQGESVTLTYSVTIADGNGGTATQEVAITVTGENDTPVITAGGTNTATATEAVSGDTTVNVSGSFTVTDVDLSNALTVAEGATTVVWSGGSLPSGVLAALTAPGAFVVSDSNAASNAATVNWTLAPGALDLNFLAQGETILVTVPVTVSDGFGGSVTQNVVVTINGTNDSPIITGGGDTGSILEVAGVTGSGVTSPASLTGNFTVTDADENGTTTITSSFGGFTTNYGPRIALDSAQQSALAAGLTFSPIAGNDGTITWTYAVDNSAVDFLVEAEVLTATINVNVTDVLGNVTVTTVAVTITGSNDSVFQTGTFDLTGTWNEGSPAAPAITGYFGYTDADFSNHGLQVSNLNTGTLVGPGGTLTASNAANSALDDGTGEVVWSYTLAPGAADYLAVGQSATEIFRVRVIDTAGTPLDQVVTITIEGTNDAPVISTAARDGTMNEDAPAVFSSGSILFNDVDVLDIHTATTSVVVSGDTAGQVFNNASLLSFFGTTVNSTALAANGSVNYTFTPNSAAFQYLQVGQTLTLTYTVAVSDGQGGSASQTVTVNVSGSNDGPVAVLDVNGMDVVTEAGAAGAGDGSATGNVLTNDTDADFGDTQMVAGVQAGAATGPLSTGAASTIIGTYGSINIAANGTYTYTLNNSDADTQALDDGDIAHDLFSYTVVDSQGVTSTSTIDISIDGSNDTPVIGAFTQPAAVVELVGASAQNIAAITGSFTVTDVDASDTLTPIVAAPVVLLNGMSFAGAPAALLAALNITPATQNSSSGAVQTFNYSYDPAAADLDFLNVGETLTIRYAVSVDDGDDVSNTQNIDITITGTNDTPVATGVVTVGSALTESNAALTTSGTVTFTDVDAGDIVTATYVPATDGAVSATGIVLTGAQIAAIQSGFSINASGAFTFNLPSPDYLSAGNVVTAVFTVHGTDTHGVSTTQDVTLTITGSNDGPTTSVIGTDNVTASLTETNAELSANGTFTVGDLDTFDVDTASVFYIIPSGNISGLSYSQALAMLTFTTGDLIAQGSNTGSLAWTFNSSASSFDYLTATDTLTLTYQVEVTDSSGAAVIQNVEVTINGSNDVPTIAAASSVSGLAEDGTLTATGDASSMGANWNDVDTGEDAVLAVTQGSAGAAAQTALTFDGAGALANEATISGTYGSLYIKADGTYRYVLNNADTDTQALDAGQGATDVFNYTISDGSGGTRTSTITANIQGANDTAIITVTDLANVTENNTTSLVNFTVASRVAITDIDSLDAASPVLYIPGSGSVLATSGPAAIPGPLGDLVTFDAATGAVSYDRAAFNWLALGESVTYTVYFEAQSGDDGAEAQELNFTITGQNDAPIAVGEAGTRAENVGGTFAVMANDSDPDLNDTISVTGINVASVNGLGVLTPAEMADIANDFSIVGNQLVFAPSAGLPGSAEAVYDRLNPGQTATIVIAYTVMDNNGGTSIANFTLSITGAAETFTGTALDDNPFNGSNGDDIMFGLNGDDVIFGNSGNDTLYGDQGNDTLNGGSGDDSLYGGVGSDNLIGGSDTDTAFMDGTWASYVIAPGIVPGTYLLTSGGFTDTLTTIELVSFAGGAPVAIATILNDAPVITGANFAIDENITGSVILGSVTATDADFPLGDIVSYSITGGNAGGNFAIDPATGVITLASGQTLDREAAATYPLTVTATDVHGATAAATVTITVNDLNDTAPVFSSGATANVDENASATTVVYDANATDADATFGPVTYSLSGTDAAAFNIDPVTGEVRLNISADYEVRTNYAINVVATQGTTATVQAVAVTINDRNDNNPVFSSSATANLDENTATTTVVYDANATDADATFGPIFYSLSGTDAAAFNIDAVTGEVRLNASADYETQSSYAINVVATQGATATTQAVAVTINDRNDNNPVFSSATTASIDENAAATTVVYDANATDADVSFGPITYSLSGADAAAFNIDAVTGEVRLNASADYEVRTSYAINVDATQGTTTTSRAVTVSVNDLNDNNPVFTSGATGNVDENAVTTTVVYDANATDADASFGPITYSLSGTDAAAFNIDAVTGEVRLNASADYEVRTNYAINVVATQGSTATTQAVAVTINDRNDNNPVFSSATTASVAENEAATTVVYDANATDADASFGPIAYSLSGADAAAFNIDAVTGEVRLNTSADYEARSAYAINVVATQGTTTTTQSVAVSIVDRNDNTPVFTSGMTGNVDENAPTTTVVYDANATDADATFGPIFYSLSGTDAAAFNIDAVTGEVRLNASADYEARTSYAINVTATQGATATTQAVAVTINDRNDNNPVFSSGTTASIAENAAATTVVYDANATDADASFGPIAYSLSGADAAAFNIDAVTGEVRLNASADYEARSAYAINVVATQGTTATSRAVTVSVNDLNDNNPAFASGATGNVDENAATTTVVYDANATDVDATFGPITYSLSGADAAAFNIDAATGEVRLNASADYEVRTNYAINVTATQGATATTQAVVVSVNDRNDNNPVFSSGTTAIVAENAATTTVVYDANATDADATFGPISYSLSGADAAAFNIDVATGEVRLNASANYEVRTNYAINVVATQGATATSRAVTISVNDVNEFAVGALSFTSVAVNEVTSTGLLAGTALAVDGDGTATVSYALLDNAGGRFVINATSGVISVANGVLLDFEQLRSHTVTVRATSSDGSFADGTTTITVNDVNPEMIVGTSANETIIGGAGADNISLAGGNDTLYGRGGDDILNGGAGADRLIGGAGNDVAVYGTASTAPGVSIIRAANGALLVNDGSGSVDILSGIEQVQFSNVTLNPAGYARSDINGDGTSDILTYSQSTGLITRTNISNGVVTSTAILASTSQGPGDTTSGNWDAQATGDFNYDGTSDLVLKNQVTGQFYIWTFTGQAQTGSSNLGVIGTNWDVLSTADFNRDGNHDILWRNEDDGHLYVWTFDAMAQQNGSASLGVIGTNWTGAGVGDFDGDGDSDVMLRNSDNGRLYLYTLENGQLSGGGDVNTFGTEWIVGGVGDFNGDGISDVALKNTNTGQFYILAFDTAGTYSGINLGIIGTQFDIAATGDYNNDGTDDILWRNSTNNQVSIGLMENGNQAGGGLGLVGVFASDLIIV